MPWREVSIMKQRREFVRLASQEGVNRRELCRRFGIHPSTGYKWLGRWTSEGELGDRSRRPHTSPGRTERQIQGRLLAGGGPRASSPGKDFGGGQDQFGRPPGGPAAHLRFEREAPNRLWQMDFKG